MARRRSLGFRLVRAAAVLLVLVALAAAGVVAAVWARYAQGLPEV
jgi:hypothetical protein